MSWWAASIPADGKEIIIGEQECRVTITQVCFRESDALPDGSTATLLAMSRKGKSSWVPVAKLTTKKTEFLPLRISVEAGEDLNLKLDENGDLSDDSEVKFQPSKRKVQLITDSEVVSETSAKRNVSKDKALPTAAKMTLEKLADAKGASIAPGKLSEQPKSVAHDVDFIASPKFAGSKAGFVFKKDAKGLGYYKDVPPVVITAKSASTTTKSAPTTKKPADAWAEQVMAQREWKQVGQGLRYRDLVVGAAGGATPRRGQRVTVHYTGRLAKGGRQFDSSVGKKAFSFAYGGGEVIRGWDMGLDGMRVGGRRELEIPPGLGYGARGAKPDIPGNATLLFEIQLLKC